MTQQVTVEYCSPDRTYEIFQSLVSLGATRQQAREAASTAFARNPNGTFQALLWSAAQLIVRAA